MKHVRIALSAGGQEAEIHPMYDVLVNAPYVDRATAMHWNVTDEEFGIMHYVEGDVGPFRSAVAAIPEVIEFELTTAGEDAFYVYVRDAMNEPLGAILDLASERPVVVVPPVEYAEDGWVYYSVFGPEADVQRAIEQFPEPITVEVQKVGGLDGVPGVLDSLLSDRQRQAIDAALASGYYEIPRSAGQDDVAAALGCAPSTAAEHLRKAEAKLVRATMER